MGKISQGAGPSHAVPDAILARIKTMRTNGATPESLRLQLNEWAIPCPDHNGVPQVGIWSPEAVEQLLNEIEAAK